ncbi:EamA domain-containing membrane protein RarD [Microbacterium sp. cf046]|uniref:DMT family transporter n=1 Tax=Microbacterium sp. cf046 TaxID=1761803 RepID=UPI0008E3739E|nr:DMT family transporter [Microbacterium sp. cf046]SFS14995.1 EamA domain-containing membrane protein RarD [Microbacterium sp. cf046]
MTHRWLPLGAIGLSVVLWSAAYVGSSWALETGSPAVLSVSRFAIALIVLIPLAARRPAFLRTLREPRTILLGLTGVTLYYSLANIGLLFTTPGTAALTAAFLPVLTAAAAVVMIRERLSRRTWIGLALATAGVALVAASGFRIDVGVLLNIAALASYAIYTVLLRRDGGRPDSPDALVLATATGVWGTALMLPWLGWEAVTGTLAVPSDARGLISILALALVVTAPTLVLFNYGAERLPAAVSGVATAAIPALGYGFALLLGEPLDPIKAVGGAIALVGVLIATLASPDVEPSPPGSGLPEPAEIAGTHAVHDPHAEETRP